MKWKMNLKYLPVQIINFFYYMVIAIVLLNQKFNYTILFAYVLPSQKLLPAQLSDLADAFFAFLIFIGNCCSINLLFHNMNDFNLHFRMYAIFNKQKHFEKMTQNGRKIEHNEAEKILNLHTKSKKLIQFIYVLIQIECQPFYYFNLFNNWENNFVDYFSAIWITILVPFFVMGM